MISINGEYSVLDIRIAERNIRVMHLYSNIKEECSKYICHFSKPDFVVFSKDAEIDDFMRTSVIGLIPRAKDFDTQIAITFDYGYYEALLICQKIADALIGSGIIMVHGAAIEINGKGFVFTAPSGVGKTTHILNWQKMYPSVSVINGDKPFVDMRTRKVYGSPWCGKEKIGDNISAHLSGVIQLERGSSNSIRPIRFVDAVPSFIEQIHVPRDRAIAIMAYRYFYAFREIPFYRLICTKSVQSAVTAYNGLIKEGLL